MSDSDWCTWFMVQIEAPSTPECQEGVPSQGGHQREEHRVVHHVQEEHYEGHIQWAWVIVTGVHGSGRSPKYPWVSAKCHKSSQVFSERNALNHDQNHEQNHEPWTINQGLTLSTTRSSFTTYYMTPTWKKNLFSGFFSSKNVPKNTIFFREYESWPPFLWDCIPYKYIFFFSEMRLPPLPQIGPCSLSS